MVNIVCGRCQICGKRTVMTVNSKMAKRIADWASTGITSVQVAFPDLNADQREMLISGTHPACFDNAFRED